jgi:co-chaperonin GroES (HSP10)
MAKKDAKIKITPLRDKVVVKRLEERIPKKNEGSENE